MSSLTLFVPLVAVLAAVPLGALRLVRRGRPEAPPRRRRRRFLALYLLIALILLLAAIVDDLPMSLGILGVILGLFGLGVGLDPLYRFLYGDDWLARHPGVVRADAARWERVTLLAALLCLVAAIVLALVVADVAVAQRGGARSWTRANVPTEASAVVRSTAQAPHAPC